MINASPDISHLFCLAGNINPTMAAPDIRMIKNTESRCPSDASFSRCPFVYSRSLMKRIKMLKILLPSRLPTAISVDPRLMAESETATSGMQVEIASNKVPVNACAQPKSFDKCSAKKGSAYAAAIILDA